MYLCFMCTICATLRHVKRRHVRPLLCKLKTMESITMKFGIYGYIDICRMDLTSVCYRCNITRGGRARVIGIATGYELDGTGFESRWGRDFSDPSRPPLRPTQPPGLFPRVKRLGRGSDHPPPPSAGVENGFSSTSSIPSVPN